MVNNCHSKSTMFFSLISDFSEIFEVDIAVLILGCGTGICVTMLMIQMEIVSVLSTCLNCNLIISICFSKSHDTINEMVLWKAVFYGFWVCALLLLVGEVGQKLSEKFTEINGVMDQLNWYAYPREVKRMLPMILTNLQQPVIIKCFVFIFCDREYSKRVSLFHHQNQLFCSINSLQNILNILTDLRHRLQILHGFTRNGKLSAIHRFYTAWLVMN